VDRKFNFDFPAALYPEIVERLRGTPARIEERIELLPQDILTSRSHGPWSIQENVGHLADTEHLFLGRLDDYAAGAETLRPADMTNLKTHEAGHNDKLTAVVLHAFHEIRGTFVGRLDRLEPGRFAQTAMHPRLEQPMRLVDMMYFMAEHDDYHLARITELARLSGA
jgi:uncharacterized damage-inducible protein DinB